MDENRFKFKYFEVSHFQSSMKVGVDAVLLGSWAETKGNRILDVGTGCGVISLMLAQRFPDSQITAIDIDQLSVTEATENFRKSQWTKKLIARLESFPNETLLKGEKYDLIVSNPPFFNSGITSPESRREKARHQKELSPFSLVENSSGLLNPGGSLCMIFPAEFTNEIIRRGEDIGLHSIRLCGIRNNPHRPEKRVMLEMSPESRGSCEVEHLILFEEGEPTPRYLTLCKDFYLKF